MLGFGEEEIRNLVLFKFAMFIKHQVQCQVES